ncbi:unnamed protein product [Pleuronectes platessa]|uniref:Uncharacterized protein n=1 Tax=Pleuronectes platessa TaxID=8262 RepID=A0A9N7V8S9_PLEPL|nr:unnamed protein product [Pleuronectes platessa]
MALIEDIIVNVGEFHGQQRETLGEMDGEMRSSGGGKDCKLEVGIPTARARSTSHPGSSFLLMWRRQTQAE